MSAKIKNETFGNVSVNKNPYEDAKEAFGGGGGRLFGGIKVAKVTERSGIVGKSSFADGTDSVTKVCLVHC